MAGTGKTTILRKVKKWGDGKIELIGLAPTRVAVNVMKKTVDIEAGTLAGFTMKYDGVIKGRGTERGRNKMKAELANKLVILDEASLASTKGVRKLGILAEQLQFRVVMIGDARQQGGVEAGKPFYYLQDHGMGTAIVRDIKRQENRDLLQAVYRSEKAVDDAEASKHIYQALKLLGKKNIIDLSMLDLSSKKEAAQEKEGFNNKEEITKGGRYNIDVRSNSNIRKIRAENIKDKGFDEQIEKFLSNRYLIQETAIRVFGRGRKISMRGDEIRFGKKGSIVANVKEGIWYDFEKGEGGSLFKFCMEEVGSMGGHISKNDEKTGNKEKIQKRDREDERAELVREKYKQSKAILEEGSDNLGKKYLNEERRINIGNINFSEDIRYIGDKKERGLVSIARDRKGNVSALQTVYLDDKGRKNKGLEVSKRTRGILKGSYVEVTKNRDAREVYIAEGIETALSIASVERKARVICSLGVANMRNIDLRDDERNNEAKNIVICADNDGDNANSKNAIEESVMNFKGQGYEVFVIKPDVVGEDFNDVLKNKGEKGIKEYTDKVLLEMKGLEEKAEGEKDKGSNRRNRINNEVFAGSCYGKWRELRHEGKEALIVAPSNNLRDEINKLVRKHFIKGESQKQKTYDNLNKTRAQIGDIEGYSGKEIVVFNKGIKSLGIKKDEIFKIGEVGEKDIKLIRFLPKGGQESIRWKPEEKSKYATLYEVRKIMIAEGERIRWTRNSSKHSFMINGSDAVIKKIEGNNVAIKTDKGEEKVLPLDELRFMDYGYSTTSYSSQGKTEDYVIGVARSREEFLALTHQRSFYVTLSRARKEAYLIIDNYKNLIKSLARKTGDKTSSIEHQTLEKSIIKSTEIKGMEELGIINTAKSHLTNKIGDLMNEYQNIKGVNERTGLNKEISSDIYDIANKVSRLKKEIEVQERKFKLQRVYKEPDKGLVLWDKLVEKYGLQEAEKRLARNPRVIGKLEGKGIFFIKDEVRKKVMGKVNKVINRLVNIGIKKEKLVLKERVFKELDADIRNKLKELANLKTEGLSYQKIAIQIREIIKSTMFKMGDIEDITNKIAKRITEQIMEFRDRYKKEPNGENKISFYIKARYEDEREKFYKSELQNGGGMKDLEIANKVKTLAKIDASSSKKEGGYHVGCNPKEVFGRYDNLQARTMEITKSYMKQGIPFTKANIIATKVVDYEICYGNYPNVRKLRDIEGLSEKLTKDYKLLLKMGLTKNEAIIVCSKLNDTSFNIQKSEKNMDVISNKIELGKDKFLSTSGTSQTTRKISNSKGIDKPPSMANNAKVEKDMGIEI